MLVLAVSTALAGCIGTDDGPAGTTSTDAAAAFAPFTPAAPDFDFATVIEPDHPRHDDPAAHVTTHGLMQVGHTGIGDVVPAGTPGSISAVDIWGDWAAVAGVDGGLAFALVNISDPTAPVAVSAFLDNAEGWTARFSDDGQYVFYGCQFLPQYFVPVPLPDPGVAGCGSQALPDAVPAAPSAIVAVDVSDKAAPAFVAAVHSRGSHNLQVAAIDGVDYVFTEAVEVIRFDRAAGTLEIVATVPGVHDASVERHPVTGDWLLYTGAGTDGFSIYEINDPSAPQLVYSGALEGAPGWHEQTPFPFLVDGRALLAVAGESIAGPNRIPDAVALVDVTDPAQPALLSTWKPPFEPVLPWFEYQFSVHEIAVTPQGQLAVGWYHAGVWVLDVSTKERQSEPVVLAAFQPHEPINVVPARLAVVPIPLVPFVWGAGWSVGGHLVVPDMHTGVYVLEPDWGLHPALDSGQ